nr:septation ring formation regulator EzrA [Lentilactobacillus otakiensis]
MKTKSDWQTANQAISDADSTLKEIQAGLAQLYDLNKQHKLALEELEKKYKRLREDILNKNQSFGPSIDNLEKKCYLILKVLLMNLPSLPKVVIPTVPKMF